MSKVYSIITWKSKFDQMNDKDDKWLMVVESELSETMEQFNFYECHLALLEELQDYTELKGKVFDNTVIQLSDGNCKWNSSIKEYELV